MRRWAAAALFHAGVPHPLVTQVLRHAATWSDESYILASAKLTAVPAAPRMPPLGMPVFAAATPGGRFDATAGPRRPPAGLGATPQTPGASGHGPGGRRPRRQGGPHRHRVHPDSYRGRAIPEGQVFRTPAPGPRLHVRDPTDGRLERFAIMVTGRDRAADGDRLATLDAAHERVPLGEGAPFGYDAIVLLPEGRPPPEAPADLASLAAYAMPWPTAPRSYSVARPPHSLPGRPAARAGPSRPPGSRAARTTRWPTAPPLTPAAAQPPPRPPGGRVSQRGAPPVTTEACSLPRARPPSLSLSLSPLCGDAALGPRHILRFPPRRAPRHRHRPDTAHGSALSGTASHSGFAAASLSFLTFWLRCCLSFLSPPLPPGETALRARPGFARSSRSDVHWHLCPCSAPILQPPIRRFSPAAAWPAAVERRRRSPRSTGRFRQLRSERIRSSVVNGGRRPE